MDQPRPPRRLRATRARCALAAAVLLAPAAGAIEPGGPVVVGLVFENHTRDTLSGVRLTALEERRYVECGYIPPGGFCGTGFPARRYEGQRLAAQWTRAGRTVGTRPFVIPLPDDLPRGIGLEALVVIGGADGFRAGLRRPAR